MPLRFLFECPTVKSLAVRIGQIKSGDTFSRRATSSRSQLFELKPGKRRQPIFFLPGGFGGDREFLVYARLVHFVGDAYRFCGLRARSADGIRRVHETVEEMASDYLETIRSEQSCGPYYLVGNCIGGVVAYEIARQLEAQQQKVALLILMDTWCPTKESYRQYRRRRLKERLQYRYRERYFPWLNNYYLARTVHHVRRIRRLRWREQLSLLTRKLRDAIEESPEVLLSLISAKFRVGLVQNKGTAAIREGYIDRIRRYRPKPYQGSVVMLNNETTVAEEPTLGWKEFVRGGIEVHTIPGDHDAYITDYVRIAGAKLQECLARVTE